MCVLCTTNINVQVKRLLNFVETLCFEYLMFNLNCICIIYIYMFFFIVSDDSKQ